MKLRERVAQSEALHVAWFEEREIRSRDSAFSVERVFLLLYHVYNRTLYFIFRHFTQSREFNKWIFTCLRALSRDFDTRTTSLSVLEEIFAYLSHTRGIILCYLCSLEKNKRIEKNKMIKHNTNFFFFKLI